jgi:hypothetical protein
MKFWKLLTRKEGDMCKGGKSRNGLCFMARCSFVLNWFRHSLTRNFHSYLVPLHALLQHFALPLFTLRGDKQATTLLASTKDWKALRHLIAPPSLLSLSPTLDKG